MIKKQVKDGGVEFIPETDYDRELLTYWQDFPFLLVTKQRDILTRTETSVPKHS